MRFERTVPYAHERPRAVSVIDIANRRLLTTIGVGVNPARIVIKPNSGVQNLR
jgi:hypothetical protein